MPAPDHLDRSQLTSRLGQLAERHGWRYHHSLAGRTAAGFNDFFPAETLLRGHRLVFVVVAGPGGRIHPRQQEWIDALASVTDIRTAVVSRQDLESLGQLERVLRDPT